MEVHINVGVVMTVLNGENYIQEAIDSLMDQTYQNWNLFIVENASKDRTKDIIQKFNFEERIKIDFLKKSLPRTQALNYGFKMLPISVDYNKIPSINFAGGKGRRKKTKRKKTKRKKTTRKGGNGTRKKS